jgi:cysteinyl-tRNA synthetase
VKYWLHCHHLIVNGEKMAKSKGNYFTLRDLVEQKHTDPAVLRYLLLSTHYRKVLNFTFEALEQAAAALQRIKDFLYELESRPFPKGKNSDVQVFIEETRTQFVEGLSDDLNISLALTAIFEFIKKMNILVKEEKIFADDASDASFLVYSLDEVLAVLARKKAAELPDELRQKIQERELARRNRNYRLADKIRNELLEAGVVLEDTKDGVRWKIVGKTP